MLDYITRRQAFELFEAGVGYKTVSRRLNLSIYTAREWMRRFKRGNIAFFDKDYIVPVKCKFDDEDTRKAVTLYESGLSLGQIAKILQTSRQTVKKWISNA